MSKTIVDATVWLNFAAVDSVTMLAEGLAGRLVVGHLVEREIRVWPVLSERAGQPFSLEEYVRRAILERAEMTPEELSKFGAVKARLRLGDGETEAFVLAASRGWSLASDDGPARRRFALHDPAVRVTGTIGLLKAMVQMGVLAGPDAAELVTAMRARGRRLPEGAL